MASLPGWGAERYADWQESRTGLVILGYSLGFVLTILAGG